MVLFVCFRFELNRTVYGYFMFFPCGRLWSLLLCFCLYLFCILCFAYFIVFCCTLFCYFYFGRLWSMNLYFHLVTRWPLRKQVDCLSWVFNQCDGLIKNDLFPNSFFTFLVPSWLHCLVRNASTPRRLVWSSCVFMFFSAFCGVQQPVVICFASCFESSLVLLA